LVNASCNAVPVCKFSGTIVEGACVGAFNDDTLEFLDREVADVVIDPARDNDEDVDPDLDRPLDENESPVDLRDGG